LPRKNPFQNKNHQKGFLEHAQLKKIMLKK